MKQPNFNVPFEGIAGSYQPQRFVGADIAGQMERENAAFERRQGAYEKSILNNLDTKVKNAGIESMQQALVFKELGAFSKQALEIWQGIEEQSKKDREIGETYDALFGDAPANNKVDQATQEEEEAVAVGESQGPVVAQMALNAEQQQGSREAAQVVRQSVGGLAEGVAGEKALLMQAQTMHGSWTASYLQSNAPLILPNGQKTTVAQAANSTDPIARMAAVRQSRYAFMDAFNLRGATKTNMVKFLGNTIVQNEASIARGLAEASIKAERDSNIQRLEGLGYNAGRTTGAAQAQANYDELSSQFFVANTGLTRGEAADRAFNSLKEAYIDTGNVDALQALLDVKKIPGQDGTEFRRTHSREIFDAIEQAQDKVKTIKTAKVTAIRSQMEEQLAGASSVAERSVIVRRSADAMRDAGAHEAARKLEQNFKTLSAPGGVAINNERVTQAVIDGEITSLGQLEKLLKTGQINKAGYDSAKSALKAVGSTQPPSDPLVKEQLKAVGDRFDSAFLTAVGLRKNLDGSLAVDPSFKDTQVVTKGQAEVLMNQARTDLTRLTNEVLSQSAGLSSQQVSAKLYTAQNEWFRTNVETPGGKYFIGDLQSLTGDPTKDNVTRKNAQNRFNSLLGSPSDLSKLTGSASLIQPRDFQSEVVQGKALPPSVITEYNPNRLDALFTSGDVKQFAADYDNGSITPHLAAVAQQMGKTPLALLNEQLRAYDLSPKLPELVSPTSSATQGKGNYSDMYSGANRLMALGFPLKGAAYISGNIMAESAWYGNRSWGAVAGDGTSRNGGLVSWASWADDPARLGKIENYLGKSIEQASDDEQLAAMMWEMKNDYPGSWRTFNNPYATKRQLEDASFAYWGFGIEGERYAFARQILERNR